MNVIARLEYELAYYDSAVHRFNHYTTRTPPVYFLLAIKSYKINTLPHFSLLLIILFTRMSQKFCNILVVCQAQFDSSGCFCQSHKGDKPHYSVRCWAHLILSECSLSDLSLWLGTQPWFFNPTWTYLIVKVLSTWVKFLETSGYCTAINWIFTFYTTDVFWLVPHRYSAVCIHKA